MINSNFFNNPLSITQIEEAIIQLNYDIIYHSSFKTKKSLNKEQKELFILISIHKWMKEQTCTDISITYIGNLHLIHHQKEFLFHFKNLNTNILSTVNFKTM